MAPFPFPTATWHTETYSSVSPTRSELSAKGKTVGVTGGGTGIGAETARSFALAGASRIALLGRRERPLLDTKASIEHDFRDVEVFVASTDVTSKAQVDATFEKFVGNGKIHVRISNAAMAGPVAPVQDVDEKSFIDAVQQNLKGTFFVAQAFLRHPASGAVAINVSSSAAHLNLAPGFAAYSVAKLAVFRLWDSLGFAHPELRIFHIQPGIVDTEMNRAAGGVKAMVSLPASFNVWLASSEARLLKGKFLGTNWDVDELKAQADEIQASPRFNIGLDGWPFEKDGAEWKFEPAVDIPADSPFRRK